MKKKRAPAPLVLTCLVCSAPAPEHLHFGGHCCYSCRAFFRRTATRHKHPADLRCRAGTKNCVISQNSKDCMACRFNKCISIGMTTDLMQGKRKRKVSTTQEELSPFGGGNFSSGTGTKKKAFAAQEDAAMESSSEDDTGAHAFPLGMQPPALTLSERGSSPYPSSADHREPYLRSLSSDRQMARQATLTSSFVAKDHVVFMAPAGGHLVNEQLQPHGNDLIRDAHQAWDKPMLRTRYEFEEPHCYLSSSAPDMTVCWPENPPEEINHRQHKMNKTRQFAQSFTKQNHLAENPGDSGQAAINGLHEAKVAQFLPEAEQTTQSCLEGQAVQIFGRTKSEDGRAAIRSPVRRSVISHSSLLYRSKADEHSLAGPALGPRQLSVCSTLQETVPRSSSPCASELHLSLRPECLVARGRAGQELSTGMECDAGFRVAASCRLPVAGMADKAFHLDRYKNLTGARPMKSPLFHEGSDDLYPYHQLVDAPGYSDFLSAAKSLDSCFLKRAAVHDHQFHAPQLPFNHNLCAPPTSVLEGHSPHNKLTCLASDQINAYEDCQCCLSPKQPPPCHRVRCFSLPQLPSVNQSSAEVIPGLAPRYLAGFGQYRRVAGSDHAVAGSDHAVAGSDHAVAGSDHAVAGRSHLGELTPPAPAPQYHEEGGWRQNGQGYVVNLPESPIRHGGSMSVITHGRRWAKDRKEFGRGRYSRNSFPPWAPVYPQVREPNKEGTFNGSLENSATSEMNLQGLGKREESRQEESSVGEPANAAATAATASVHPPIAVIRGQQKSLTDALNEIIPGMFDELEVQPVVDHELIHSDLFRTAESLLSSTIFSMCIDNFANEIPRPPCRDAKNPLEMNEENLWKTLLEPGDSLGSADDGLWTLESNETSSVKQKAKEEQTKQSLSIDQPKEEPAGKMRGIDSPDDGMTSAGQQKCCATENHRHGLYEKRMPEDDMMDICEEIVGEDSVPESILPDVAVEEEDLEVVKQEEEEQVVQMIWLPLPEDQDEEEVEREGSMLTRQPEVTFTEEEGRFLDKMKAVHDVTMSCVVRFETNAAIIDATLGHIPPETLFRHLASGKGLQTYNFLQIAAQMPSFKELSSSAQKFLIGLNMDMCWELRCAVFFWGHDVATVVEQEQVTGISVNMTFHLNKYRREDLNCPALNFDLFYGNAASVKGARKRHREVSIQLGRTFKGVDVRLYPLVFAIALFSIEPADMLKSPAAFSPKDISIVRTVQQKLAIIYKRFLKQTYGWKKAASRSLEQAYLLTAFKQCLQDLNKERMEMAFKRQTEILEKELSELQN